MHDITLTGSIIGSGDTLTEAVEIAKHMSDKDFSGRLLRVHGVDGETVLAEVRSGEIEMLAPGVRVGHESFPDHGPRAQVGTVIAPDQEMQAWAFKLAEFQRTAVTAVRWDANEIDQAHKLWSSFRQLRVLGFEQPSLNLVDTTAV